MNNYEIYDKSTHSITGTGIPGMFNWRQLGRNIFKCAKWILESPINEAKNAGAANTPVPYYQL